MAPCTESFCSTVAFTGQNTLLMLSHIASPFLFAPLSLIGLLIASSAHPWGSKGHEIVAAIAEAHLTEPARKQIKNSSRKLHTRRCIDVAG